MDYGMIGKIEKAKFYAQERHRITFDNFSVNLHGNHSSHQILLNAEGWHCDCSAFHSQGICPHVMAVEYLFQPMLKRERLPYAAGQNVVSDVEKAKRYRDDASRFKVGTFEVTFHGENSDHHTTYNDGKWTCDCAFFHSRHVCSHTMAMERILTGMLPVEASEAASIV